MYVCLYSYDVRVRVHTSNALERGVFGVMDCVFQSLQARSMNGVGGQWEREFALLINMTRRDEADLMSFGMIQLRRSRSRSDGHSINDDVAVTVNVT